MNKLGDYEILLKQAVNQLDSDDKFVVIDYEGHDYNFSIKVSGGWQADRIDIRTAKYIIQLQHAVDDLHKDTFGMLSPKDRKLVQVQIRDGSVDLLVLAENILKDTLGTMTDASKLILFVTGILSIAGVFSLKEWLGYKKFVAEKADNADARKSTERLLQTVASKLPNYEAAPKALINSMSDEDMILLPGADDPMPKELAKMQYPRAKRQAPQREYVDGVFHISAVDFDKSTAAISRDNLSLSATLILNTYDIGQFYKKVEKYQTDSMAVEIELQVNVVYTPRGIRTAEIVGLGSPRDGAISPADLGLLF